MRAGKATRRRRSLALRRVAATQPAPAQAGRSRSGLFRQSLSITLAVMVPYCVSVLSSASAIQQNRQADLHAAVPTDEPTAGAPAPVAGD